MRMVRLPAKMRVTDLLERRVVATGVTEFPLTLDANRTVILGLER
jgi:hypothetical protein